MEGTGKGLRSAVDLYWLMMMMVMVMMMMMITMVVETGMMQSWLANVKWQRCDIFGDKSTSDEIHVRPSDF